MAANQMIVSFQQGLKTRLSNVDKVPGQVLFVLNNDHNVGSIYFDQDATHRYRMSYDLKDISNTFTISSTNISTTNGRVYPVGLDKDGYLAVNVPWSNSEYNAGIGLTLAAYNTFDINLKNGSTQSSLSSNNTTSMVGRQYAVELDSDDNLSVNIPWTPKLYTGVCETAAATTAKVVTSNSPFILEKGAVIFVTFSNTNSGAVGSLTMNVDNTGAKPIKHQYNATESNLPDKGYLRANQTYTFYYDGTNWVCITDYNSNTTYSAMSVDEMKAGTSETSRTMRAKYLKTFLSTLGGTGLVLTHDATNGIVLDHSNSIAAGTSSGSSGTLTFGGSISIPSISYDAQGHITSVSTTSVTLPANPNVDTKVTQTNTTGNADYRILFSGTADDTDHTEGARKNTSLKYNPSTTTLTVPTLKMSTQSAAYSNGIMFYNGTSKKGSVGTDNNGIIGLYGTKIVLRPELDAATKGVEVTSSAMYPTATMTLGTSSNKWNSVYANTFYGDLDGNASTATLADTATLALTANKLSTDAGTKYNPVYFTSGIPVETSGYTVEYIKGTQSASTASWTGVSKDAELYDGKMIVYVLPYAGTSTGATLALTLSTGVTTTAVPIYRYGNSTAITTHYAAGSRIFLIYDGVNNRWNSSAWYNSDTNTLLRVYASSTNIDVPLIGQSSANSGTAAWTAYTSSYKDWYGAIPSDNSKKAKINLSTGHITVPGGITANITGDVTGDLTGTADVAIKLGTDTVGSTTKPIYLNAGTPTEGSTYAGGTAVTLNGVSKAASTASFYAPAGAGTSGQYLKSNGSGAPTWENLPSMAPASHTHGNISNDGKISSDQVTVANNDFIVIGDSSGSGKLEKGPIFDGTTATKALTQAGTWVTFTANTGTVTSIATGTGLTGGPITTSGTISLANTAVTAGSYGPSAAINPLNAVGGEFNVPYITVDAQGRLTAASNKKMTLAVANSSITNAMLVNSSVTIAGTSVSLGSSISASTLRSNLGLSSAMHFIGRATVAITDGSTSDPTISGYTFSNAQAGDVILGSDNQQEFVWDGTSWELLGQESSFKVLQSDQVTTPAASGTATSFITSITQNVNGDITNISKSTVPTASTSTAGIIQITTANMNSFLGTLPTWTADPTDNTYFIRQDTGGAASYGKVKFSTLWNYIKSKADAVYSSANILSDLDYADPDYDAAKVVSKVTVTDGVFDVDHISISPSVTITAGTSSAAPKVNITVLGQSGTAQSITTATTGVYGVTKLTDSVSSTGTTLAVTQKGAYAAAQSFVGTLDVSDAAVTGQFVSEVDQTDGKISVTRADFAPSITITAGTASAAPKVNVTVNSKSGTAQSITTATTGLYGVTKLSSTSSASEEGLAATPKGVWAAIDTVKYKVTQKQSTANSEYPIILKYDANTTEVTNTVNFNSTSDKQTTINPSTGTISADSYKVAAKVHLLYNDTTASLNFVFI